MELNEIDYFCDMKKITRTQRPLILITNDDGIHAKGINVLARYLQPLADIVVVAPDSPRSGQSSAITVSSPLRMKMVEECEGIRFFSTTGTPVDCVKLAINLLLDEKPDLIVSGINHGSNAAVNVIYSGTMGAVNEGALLGIPSIGLSLCSHNPDADFEPCRAIIIDLCQRALACANSWKKGMGLNVNFPKSPEVLGAKFCRAARGHWSEEYDCRIDPNGKEYYWLTGRYENSEPNANDTDEYWLSRGYASIAPTLTDLTDQESLPNLPKLLGME